MTCHRPCSGMILRKSQADPNQAKCVVQNSLKAGRTQTNNAQLYLAQPFIEWLSHEKLLSAGDC